MQDIKSFYFTIKGKNPNIERVFNYLDEEPFSDYWFYKKLIHHESNTPENSRYSSEMKQFNSKNKNYENLKEDWDAWSRCPNRGCPCGWGLGQLDKHKPHKQSLWDWKFNIYDIHNRITVVKESEVSNRLNNYLDAIEAWETRNPAQDGVEGHDDYKLGGYNWVHGESDLFFKDNNSIEEYFNDNIEKGEISFLDGMILKSYNGIGSGSDDHDFYYLYEPSPTAGNDDPKPYWSIDETAHYANSVNRYVEDICERELPKN